MVVYTRYYNREVSWHDINAMSLIREGKLVMIFSTFVLCTCFFFVIIWVVFLFVLLALLFSGLNGMLLGRNSPEVLGSMERPL